MKKVLVIACVSCWAFGLIGYYFHAIELNPQFDTQGIRYAAELQQAVIQGNAMQWWFHGEPRKYPMLYVIPFTVGNFLVSGGQLIALSHEHYIVRAITVLYALATLVLLWFVARKYFDDDEYAALTVLGTSIIFFEFATAVRPHIAVTFWTALALFLSLRLRERYTFFRTLSAFGAAACAFATLQSGLLAFIFPLWALVWDRWSVKQVSFCVAWFLPAVFLGFALGYPQMYGNLVFGSDAAFDPSMGHDVGFHWSFWIIPLKIGDLFSVESILCILGVLGAYKAWKAKELPVPLILYVVSFIILFGMQPIASARFFLPLFPLLALLAVPVLREYRWIQPTLLVLNILVFCKLGFLAFHQNTYQQASASINASTGYLVTSIPTYFLDVPDDRYALSTTPLTERYIFLLRPDDHVQNVESQRLCGTFTATNAPTELASTPFMFFWNEVRWPLYYLLRTKSLGINLRLYCNF